MGILDSTLLEHRWRIVGDLAAAWTGVVGAQAGLAAELFDALRARASRNDPRLGVLLRHHLARGASRNGLAVALMQLAAQMRAALSTDVASRRDAAAASAALDRAVADAIEGLSLVASALARTAPKEAGLAAREALALLAERAPVGIDGAAIEQRCRAVLGAESAGTR